MARLPAFDELGRVSIEDPRAAEPDFRATRDAAANITATAAKSGKGAEALGEGIAYLGKGIASAFGNRGRRLMTG